MRKTTCSKCNEELDNNRRYCRQCNNAYMRNLNKRHRENNTDVYKRLQFRSRLKNDIKRGRKKKPLCIGCQRDNAILHVMTINGFIVQVWKCAKCWKDDGGKLNGNR